jgi:uncharacterized protein YabE (DUF348 family)
MIRKPQFFLPLGLVVMAGLLAFFFLQRQVTIVVDGQPRTIHTFAVTVGDALRAARIAPRPEDQVQPAAETLLAGVSTITLERARPVSIFYKGIPFHIVSSNRQPVALLAQAGLVLSPDDHLYLDGQRVLLDQPLPPGEQYALQVRPALEIRLDEDGQARTLRSAAPTLADALWEAGISLRPGDRLEPAASTRLVEPVQVRLRRAAPLVISVGERVIHTRSAAESVGQALAEAGVALQGLDVSEPEADQPLPASGQIRVMRVREDIVLAQTVLPFESSFQPDAETDLDTRKVIEPGQYGLKVTRERVRYQDGVEVSRQSEAEWVVSEPKTQVVGLGTRPVVQTLDTPDGPMEYYRTATVYATSYSPCRQGMGRCSKSTASGIPLSKGVVAMTQSWYAQFAGQRIYIPGYGVGVVADTGGGIPGTPWIDLGYDEENFTNWHENVTIYFLTPVPANVPWRLP